VGHWSLHICSPSCHRPRKPSKQRAEIGVVPTNRVPRTSDLLARQFKYRRHCCTATSGRINTNCRRSLSLSVREKRGEGSGLAGTSELGGARGRSQRWHALVICRAAGRGFHLGHQGCRTGASPLNRKTAVAHPHLPRASDFRPTISGTNLSPVFTLVHGSLCAWARFRPLR
jgi:hypothetical protein